MQLTIPRARADDPATSHAAAASVKGLRDSQNAVLRVLWVSGPATDEQIAVRYEHLADAPRQSPSGLRTRRKELVERGLVVDTGHTRKLKSGRKAILWAA